MTSPRTRWRALTPRRRGALKLTPLAPVSAAALLALGADLAHALTAAAAVLALTALTATDGRGTDTPWPRPSTPARDGARRDLAELGWSIVGTDGRVNERAVRRTRALAVRRLAASGVELDDPRAAELLGRRVHAQMTSPRYLPTPRTLQGWLDAIDRLGAHRSHRTAPRGAGRPIR